jgi:hypothetical protein
MPIPYTWQRVSAWCGRQRAELGDRIARGGQPVPLADGGVFDWLATLTSNRRAAYIASGMGAQIIALLFGDHPLRAMGPGGE